MIEINNSGVFTHNDNSQDIFIIGDLHGDYQCLVHCLVDLCKVCDITKLIDDNFDYVNREFLNQESKEQLEKILLSYNFNLSTIQKISFITFCQNCIIIKKISEQDNKYQNRNYRFFNNL